MVLPDAHPSGASRWSAQPAPHCPARVSNPFSLTERSCLPSLDVPQWLIDDFFDGPTTSSPSHGRTGCCAGCWRARDRVVVVLVVSGPVARGQVQFVLGRFVPCTSVLCVPRSSRFYDVKLLTSSLPSIINIQREKPARASQKSPGRRCAKCTLKVKYLLLW